MIPKRAVRKFHNRKRDDFRGHKKYKFKELNEMRRRLPVRPPIWKKLWKDQRVCLLLGIRCRKFLFNLDTGCGKTLLSIALIRYFRRAEKAGCFLIVVPNRINLYEWESEIQIHSPKSKYILLDSSTPENWDRLMNNEASFCVVTFGGLQHMVCGLREKKKGQGNEMFISDKHINWLAKCLSGVVVDESTFVGNHSSLNTRIVRRLSNKLDIFFELTGTPFGKDPKMLWSQMYLVDKGHALGETLGLFRAAFYREEENPFSSFPDYVFMKREKKRLHKYIAHRSIRFKADESSRPKLIPITKKVPVSREALPHLEEAYSVYDKAIKGEISDSFQKIRSSFVLMRQLSSGYVGYTDVDDGSKIHFEFEEKPKLEMLTSLLESISDDHKSIVFFEYVHSGRMISRELRKLKIDHHLIQGGTKNQKEKLNSFKHDDKSRVLLLNNSCGGFGLNLQVARYGFYFESPCSPIMRTQTRRRFERQGSTHKSVFQYDLITKGTRDQSILDAIEEGYDLFESIIEGNHSKPSDMFE